MNRSVPLLFAVIALMTTAALRADTYYVVPPDTPDHEPDDFTSWDSAATNIQDAVTAAGTSGATVWVKPGHYVLNGTITIGNVKLRSWPDGLSNRDTTIVDGNYPAVTNQCFLMNHAGALVEGFTITNGAYARAAADWWDVGGGGVRMTAGTLRNCRVTGNRTYNGNGAGIYAAGANSIVDNCDLIGNMNIGGHFGGGAHLRTQAQIRNSRIKRNTSDTTYQYGGGGGVSGIREEGQIFNSVIVSNSVKAGGGGVLNIGLLRNSLVAGNISDTTGTDVGGGVAWFHDLQATRVFVIENSTIVDNVGHRAGGIWFLRNGQLYVTNSIVYNNLVQGQHTNAHDIARHQSYDNSIDVDHVLTEHTYGVTFVGEGNITDRSPVFVDAGTGDYRLTGASPGVNAGIRLDWMDAATDLAGKARVDPISGLVDMGAYEHHPGGTLILVQ